MLPLNIWRRDEWGWICSTLDDYSCAVVSSDSSNFGTFTQFRKKRRNPATHSSRIRQTFKDILQVTLNFLLAFIHAWNMLQMCIYVPDIIIMHIFYSTRRFKKQIFQTLSLTTRKIIVKFVILYGKSELFALIIWKKYLIGKGTCFSYQ